MGLVLCVMAATFAALSGYCVGRGACGHLDALARRNVKGSLSFEQALEDPVLLFALLAAVSGVVAVAFGLQLLVPCLLLSLVVMKTAPRYLERRRKELLRAACEGDLSMLCDVVAMGIDAGLSFDAALDMYCRRFDNELSKRMICAKLQWEHAVFTRSDALSRLAQELESFLLRRFADTTARAVSAGAPLAGMLRDLAADVRRIQKMRVERSVAKAPVKMLVPTGACILPAMLLLVMGPMLLQFMGH